MRTSILCGFLALLLALPGPAQQKKRKPPGLPEGVRVLHDLEFAKPEGVSLKLDLYLPVEAPDGPMPAIVWVHGGGWKNGSRANCKASWLAADGYAIASISYRLTDAGTWPDQINDCYAAVRWLRANAHQYELDPKRIGAWGSSAGGHLVALLGTRPFPRNELISSRVQAVCDWFGPSDLLTMPPNTLGNGRTQEQIAASNGSLLLAGTVREQPAKAMDASAVDHVSADDPAFLIMHGDRDFGVPLDQSARLHARLVEAGVESTLHVVEGAGHGGPLFDSPEVREAIRVFFRKHLKP